MMQTSGEETLSRAIRQHQQGDLISAERLYREVLGNSPSCVEAIHYLGVIAYQRGQYQQAVEWIGRAIELDPGKAAFHNNLGLALRALRRGDEALAAFVRALELDPLYSDALSNLGLLLHERGDRREARECFERALQFEPQHVDALYNFANALHDDGQTPAAIPRYQQALALAPQRADIHNNLANALLTLNQLAPAVEHYRAAVRLQPDFAEAHYNLGVAWAEQEQAAAAVDSFQHAVRLRPDKVLWQFRRELLWPPVFQSNAEIDQYRQRLEETLDRYQTLDLCLDWADIAACGCLPPFNLPHQGRENLPLKQKFAAVFERCFSRDEAGRPAVGWDGEVGRPAPSAEALWPVSDRATLADRRSPGHIGGLSVGSAPRSGDRGTAREADSGTAPGRLRHSRPRIGMVVTRGHEAVFLKCMAEIVNRFPVDAFQMLVFCAASAVPRVQNALHHPDVSVVTLPEQFPRAVTTLAEAACDVLYYWEVGSDALNYFLPFLRLAPVQCTSWSTLVTSGVPHLDYYLSSSLVESDDADSHYSEQLVRLNSLLACTPRTALPQPARDRSYFDLPRDKHLYVCPQNLIKFHPDFDALLANILRSDAHGLVVLKHGRWPQAGELLLQRFQRTLPDVADRIRMLPWQSHDDYLHLLALADVVLDTPHYGAGSTTYDIFSFNQPLVTWPGRYNISRYAWACYRRMDILDLVAASADEYVRIAVRLGTEPDYRESLRRRIADRSETLFDDDQAVREHQQFFENALSGTSVGSRTEIADGATTQDPPAIPSPTLRRMAASVTKSLWKFVLSGFRVVDQRTQAARVASCTACPQAHGSRCIPCGCFFRKKAWLPHETCPHGRWPALDADQGTPPSP